MHKGIKQKSKLGEYAVKVSPITNCKQSEKQAVNKYRYNTIIYGFVHKFVMNKQVH